MDRRGRPKLDRRQPLLTLTAAPHPEGCAYPFAGIGKSAGHHEQHNREEDPSLPSRTVIGVEDPEDCFGRNNARILLLHSVHHSDRRRKDWSIVVNPYSVSKVKMATLDEITKEKQRLGEALTRVDAQREKLVSQLSELETVERVLARYSKGTQPRKISSAKMPTTGAKAAAPARLRGRRRNATAKSASGSRNSPSLNDQVLALATGKTQQEITAACKGVRPNHVGAAIARHKRAGRVEERDGKLYATQPTGTEQPAAV